MSTELPRLTAVITTPSCSDTLCPTVYATDRGTVVVQGTSVAREAIAGLPDHESGVEIPESFFDLIGQTWAREHGLLP